MVTDSFNETTAFAVQFNSVVGTTQLFQVVATCTPTGTSTYAILLALNTEVQSWESLPVTSPLSLFTPGSMIQLMISQSTPTGGIGTGAGGAISYAVYYCSPATGLVLLASGTTNIGGIGGGTPAGTISSTGVGCIGQANHSVATFTEAMFSVTLNVNGGNEGFDPYVVTGGSSLTGETGNLTCPVVSKIAFFNGITVQGIFVP